jgi:hypothetical protein
MSMFRRIRRLPALVVTLCVIALAMAGLAIADNTFADGDGVTPVGNNDRALGSVTCGQEKVLTVPVAVSRNGSGTNVFKNSATVTVSVLSSVVNAEKADAAVTATVGSPNTIALPSNWGGLANNTMSDSVTSTVKITPIEPGDGSAAITYRGSGLNTGDATINRDDTMNVTWTAGSCDSTPPVITPDVQGTKGDNDWYTSDVAVGFDVNDPDSTVTSTSAGCDGGTVTSDTTGLTFTCTATSAGGSDTKSVTIKRDATTPVITRDTAADSCSVPGLNGWCRGTQTAGFSASDATSGLVGQSSPYKFTKSTSTDGSAVQISSGTIEDNAGNEAVAIEAGPFRIDSAAPVIDGSASPAANADGWNNTNVTVDFTCSDTGGSGVPGTCGPDATLTDEGRNQSVTGNVTDEAGNSASDSVSGINIDKGKPSAPTATPDKAPAYTAGGVDWFKDSVSISYGGSTDPVLNDPRDVADKSGSGVKGYSAADSLVNTSGTLNYSGHATDRADNNSDATTGTVKVDAGSPLLQVTGCPTGPVVVGSSQSLTVTASDGESGLTSADPTGTISLDTSTIGSKTVNVDAEDNVGHKVTRQCIYDVDYSWSGFYQPVDMNGVFNKAKAGSAIPVKFSLDGAPQPGSNTPGLAGAATAFMPGTATSPNPMTATVVCPASTVLVDLVEELSTDSASGLKYDPAADQWVYVWKTTTGLANSCRQLKVTLADGTTKTANFQFTK